MTANITNRLAIKKNNLKRNMEIKKILETASQKQRNELMTLIVMDGVAYPTAYSWCKGSRRPKPLYQERILKYVKDVFGIESTAEELFPERR